MTLTLPAPISAERLETRNRERLARAESLLRQLAGTAAPFTKETTITPLNDLQVELHNLGGECGIYVAMHPDPAVQQLAEKLQREAVQLGQRQLQTRPVYDALGGIDTAALDAVERRFVEIARTDMRRAGVARTRGTSSSRVHTSSTDCRPITSRRISRAPTASSVSAPTRPTISRS